MAELQFTVTLDEDGNYCAKASVPGGALFTDAEDMNGLLTMIRDVVALYEEDEEVKVEAFSLRFEPSSLAA
jgi:hypothetical protein